MSDKIKPSEVSQVLLEQLNGISSSAQFDEVGTVLQVSDGVARIYGLRNAEANELLEFENGTMAIVMNLEEDNVGCVLLGTTSGIKEGMVVKRTKRIASIRVNDNMLGRVINPLGQAIDGKGDIDLKDSFEMPLDRKAPGVIYRQPVKEPLQTGLKAEEFLRGWQTRLLYLCGYRSESLYRGCLGADPEGTWRNALHHHRGCYSCRSRCYAVLRTFRRSCYRRVFPRPWSASLGGL